MEGSYLKNIIGNEPSLLLYLNIDITEQFVYCLKDRQLKIFDAGLIGHWIKFTWKLIVHCMSYATSCKPTDI